MKNYLKEILFAAVSLALLCNFGFFVYKNSVDIPFWDEWDVADLIMQKGNWLETVTHQHNEHRIGVGLALMKILAPLTNWSQLAEIAVVSLEIIMSCLLALYAKKKISRKITLWDLIIPLIFLNILQWGNIISAFQMTFVFPLLFLFLGVWSLTVENTAKRNALIVIFSLLGAFSSFHGLFIPAVFIFFLAAESLLNRFRQWRISLPAIAAEIMIIAAYFWGYEKKFQAALNLKPDFQTLDFFTVLLANGFFYHAGVSQKYGLNYILTALAVLALVYGLYRVAIVRKNELASWIGVLLIIYSFLFALSITLGRSAFGIGQASETRYITFSMLIPLGIYFILGSIRRKNLAKFVLVVVLLGGLFSYPSSVGDSVTAGVETRKNALQCYEKTEAGGYDACFKIMPLYPDRERLNSLMPNVLKYKEVIEKTGK
ncbi:MAG: hypothetical protein FJZ04_02760 [Candidatus Moranbacteria bacterium]|nr:hypothetical protein [Candidatus Moranbacteria bacterium]